MPMSEAQEMTLMIAHALCPVCLALTVWWVNGASTSTLFLGGLDWKASAHHGVPAAGVFNWHPLLMVCGVIAETQALLTWRTWPATPRQLKFIHLLWHCAAGTLFGVGLAAVFRYADIKVTANLYSLHSWVGIAIITLYYTQLFLGFAAFVYPVASPVWRRAYLPLYTFFGGFLYACFAFQVVLGLVNKTVDQGCGYNDRWTYSHGDRNPAEHYDNIYLGCRVAYVRYRPPVNFICTSTTYNNNVRNLNNEK